MQLPVSQKDGFKVIQQGNTTKGDTQTKKQEPSSHLEHLDGLRGVAALCVALGHFCFWPWDQNQDTVFGFFKSQCLALAVPVFFVLSGRVIAISFTKQPSAMKLASLFLRRPLRLWIPILGAHLIVLLLHISGSFKKPCAWDEAQTYAPKGLDVKDIQIASCPEERIYFGYYIVQSLKLFLLQPSDVIPPSWTLPAELYFSYIIYIVSSICSQLPSFIYQIVFLLACWLISIWIQSWAALFLLGYAFCFLAQRNVFKQLQQKTWLCICLQVVCGGMVLFRMLAYQVFSFGSLEMDRWYGTLILHANGEIGHSEPHMFKEGSEFAGRLTLSRVWPMIPIFLLFEISPILQSTFSCTLAKWLGKASFGLYLVHWGKLRRMSFILAWLQAMAPRIMVMVFKAQLPFAGTIVSVYILITLSLIFICISFYWMFEKPSILLGRYLHKLLMKKQ